MNSGFQVNTEELAALGNEFGDIAGRVDTLWENHLNRIEAMGDIFGTDQVGSLIGRSYAAAEVIGDSCFSTMVDAMLNIADALEEMVSNYEDVETQNVSLFKLGGTETQSNGT
jgi:uncharacterized protein YukE